MTQQAGERSATVAARVNMARELQYARQSGRKNANAALESLCLSTSAQVMAQKISARFRFSARGYTRLLRVARTIADLAGEKEIQPAHVAEAATFRLRAGLD